MVTYHQKIENSRTPTCDEVSTNDSNKAVSECVFIKVKAKLWPRNGPIQNRNKERKRLTNRHFQFITCNITLNRLQLEVHYRQVCYKNGLPIGSVLASASKSDIESNELNV